jgi:hypothetical protein
MSPEPAGHSDLGALLRELPCVQEPRETNCLSVSGMLAGPEPGLVRVVVGGHCLSLDAADVRDVVRLSAGGEGRRAPATVCLTLRRPARLFHVELWTEFEQALCGAPRPFAFAARPHPLAAAPSNEFRARERNFLRDFGR